MHQCTCNSFESRLDCYNLYVSMKILHIFSIFLAKLSVTKMVSNLHPFLQVTVFGESFESCVDCDEVADRDGFLFRT